MPKTPNLQPEFSFFVRGGSACSDMGGAGSTRSVKLQSLATPMARGGRGEGLGDGPGAVLYWSEMV